MYGITHNDTETPFKDLLSDFEGDTVVAQGILPEPDEEEEIQKPQNQPLEVRANLPQEDSLKRFYAVIDAFTAEVKKLANTVVKQKKEIEELKQHVTELDTRTAGSVVYGGYDPEEIL